MLPPGCIIVHNKPFFFYDFIDSTDKSSMNTVHYHNFFEIYYLLSGTCDYLIEDKIYSISPNSLILIPPDTVHKTVYTSSTHKRIVLNFNDLFFNKYLLKYINEVKFCSIKKELFSQIQYLFDKMSRVTDYKERRNEILINCYINELIIFIIENNKDIACPISKPTLPIDIAIHYIAEHFDEDISLEGIAEQFNYSPDYFSKQFKKQTGSTFKKYLSLTRLTTAERLLLTTKKQISEIAFSCGFNDSNYFSYMFTKHYGISPSSYRNIKNKL